MKLIFRITASKKKVKPLNLIFQSIRFQNLRGAVTINVLVLREVRTFPI